MLTFKLPLAFIVLFFGKETPSVFLRIFTYFYVNIFCKERGINKKRVF
jgi:hypothetical protein